MKYILSEDAGRQLSDIRRFTLRNWGKEQSRAYVAELKEVFQMLSQNQDLGRACDDDFGNEIFRLHHKRHTIYYRKHEDKIVIIGIVHQSMVPMLHF